MEWGACSGGGVVRMKCTTISYIENVQVRKNSLKEKAFSIFAVAKIQSRFSYTAGIPLSNDPKLSFGGPIITAHTSSLSNLFLFVK